MQNKAEIVENTLSSFNDKPIEETSVSVSDMTIGEYTVSEVVTISIQNDDLSLTIKPIESQKITMSSEPSTIRKASETSKQIATTETTVAAEAVETAWTVSTTKPATTKRTIKQQSQLQQALLRRQRKCWR